MYDDELYTKAYYCHQTKKEYISMGEAARELGLSASCISRVVRGLQEQTGGYTFERVIDEERRKASRDLQNSWAKSLWDYHKQLVNKEEHKVDIKELKAFIERELKETKRIYAAIEAQTGKKAEILSGYEWAMENVLTHLEDLEGKDK